MGAIASGNVAVTVNKVWLAGRKRYTDVTIVFGDGALTYATNGVPMPLFSTFGFKRNLEAFGVSPGELRHRVHRGG